MARIAVAAASKLKLPNQPQLLLPPPTLQFSFPLARIALILKSLLPNQTHRPAFRCKSCPNSQVVFLNSLADVRRHSDVERPIRASHHVTKPRSGNFFGHKTPPNPEALLNFLMPRMLPASIAELGSLQPLRMLPAVLGSRIVPVFTIVALQSDDFSHGRLLDDLGNRSGAHGVPAFANREAQALLQGYRCDKRNLTGNVVPRHHHLHSCRQLHIARHIRGPKIKLRPVTREKRRVPPALNFVCGVIDPGFASTCPRSTSSFSVPRSSNPTLSPAMPSSSSLRNISTPVTVFFIVGRKPTISISSPTFTLPRSIRPVTPVPRPEIEKMSSIGIANGLSTSRGGSGMCLSTASISSRIDASHFASPSSAFSADPLITGIVSPGN